MGQLESKDSDNTTNDLSNRKEILGKARGSTISSDLNIKIDDNPEANKTIDEEKESNDVEKEKRLKKAKTYDFACSVFYGMVALLVFSTMSRTYGHFTGGGCNGAFYASHTLLAYSCVGLACALIKSLRKHIKEEIKENSEKLDKEDFEVHSEVSDNEGLPYEESTLNSKEKLNNEMNLAMDSKIGSFPVKTISEKNGILVNIPESILSFDKLSTGLPQPPLLPPPMPSMKRRVTFQATQEFSCLSAAESLKAAEMELEKQKNMIDESRATDLMNIQNDWKDIKFETEMFKHKDNHQKLEYNWMDYNLNAIDKY